MHCSWAFGELYPGLFIDPEIYGKGFCILDVYDAFVSFLSAEMCDVGELRSTSVPTTK